MQLGFYFNQVRCVGCNACVVACKDWHDVPAGPAKWMRVLYNEEGKFPKPFVSYLISPCYHCADPVCAWVCPNEAIKKREEDGIVVIDKEKCREEHNCGIISEDTMAPDFTYGEFEAPCQAACPAHLHVPGYAALISKGKFKEALDLIRRRMPLPSVCGRICLRPCEKNCRRQDVDQAIAIDDLKRFVTDYAPNEPPLPLLQTQKEKVAIIGSGPAGLAAAYDLIRMGYGVTIFESQPFTGGMLWTGVPQYRLPKEVLKRDIDYIEALGVKIRTNTPVGDGLSFDDLFQEGYAAILLALGAQRGQKLNIPGADLKGTIVGTDFMRDVNLGKKVKMGQKVVVIGGGNVGFDCARTARRLGVIDVHVACLESQDDIPAEASVIKEGVEEGILIHPSRTFTRILDNRGKVNGVECLNLRNVEFDQDGQPHVNVIEGTEHVLPADMVIFAVGQIPEMSNLTKVCKIKTTGRGTIAVDPDTLTTNLQGVFACGDAVNGSTNVIEVIAHGQKAASCINRYLQGDIVRVQPRKTIKAADIKVKIPNDIEKKERLPMPLLSTAKRISNFDEVTLGYSAEVAVEEAKRCLNCAGHLCEDVCPYSAPQFAVEVKARMQKCDLCIDRWSENKKPICIEACPVRALDAGSMDELKAKYGDATNGTGFTYSTMVKPSVIFKSKAKAIVTSSG